MKERPTVALAMIVKNEESHLPKCLASVAGLFDELGEIVGQWHDPFALFTGGGMDQAQATRLQCLARKYRCQVLFAIDRVAHQRVADRQHVHANLVRATRFQLTLHQADGAAVEQAGGDALEVGNGRLGGEIVRHGWPAQARRPSGAASAFGLGWPVMMRRNNEASERHAERRRREDEAPRITSMVTNVLRQRAEQKP